YRERVDAPAEQREERGHDGQRDQARERRDDQATDRHRAQEREREDEQRPEGGRHGDRAERDRAAGGRDRGPQRIEPGAGPRELLAVARDEQQAVVDREPQAGARHEVEREHRNRSNVVGGAQQRERRRDREDPGGDGQERGDDAAEDPDRERREQRQGDQLGAEEIALGLLLHLLVRDGRSADEAGQLAHEPAGGGAVVRVLPQEAADEHDSSVAGPARRDARNRGVAAEHALGLRRERRLDDGHDRRPGQDAGRPSEELLGAEALGALV